MKSGIYLIKNIENKKIYIGSAVNIDKRWEKHKTDLKKGKHHSCLLQRAWKKYGEQSFKFEIIQEVSNPEHLIAYEQVYLDYYKSYEDDKGYNICKVAGSTYGITFTEESKKKLSESNKGKNIGKKHSEQTRKKMSEAQNKPEIKNKLSAIRTGKKHSEETKNKLSQINKGKKLSEGAKNKLSQAKTGKKHSEQTKKKIGEANKGRNIGLKHSEEHKKKISEAMKKNRNNRISEKDINK
jgi:group I intron endonuclease